MSAKENFDFLTELARDEGLALAVVKAALRTEDEEILEKISTALFLATLKHGEEVHENADAYRRNLENIRQLNSRKSELHIKNSELTNKLEEAELKREALNREIDTLNEKLRRKKKTIQREILESEEFDLYIERLVYDKAMLMATNPRFEGDFFDFLDETITRKKNWKKINYSGTTSTDDDLPF